MDKAQCRRIFTFLQKKQDYQGKQAKKSFFCNNCANNTDEIISYIFDKQENSVLNVVLC